MYMFIFMFRKKHVEHEDVYGIDGAVVEKGKLIIKIKQ